MSNDQVLSMFTSLSYSPDYSTKRKERGRMKKEEKKCSKTGIYMKLTYKKAGL